MMKSGDHVVNERVNLILFGYLLLSSEQNDKLAVSD
jgi:hypothetical protein